MTRALCLLPLTVYLAAALGAVAVAGLVVVAVEMHVDS